jgi:1-hydroxycarotenoid 3,4-desaturase
MTERCVVIVGAGMGGLAAAVDLARQGVKVTVCEKAATVGGKIHQRMVDGRAIDSGPTVITMRWVFDDLMRSAGMALDDYVHLRPLPIIARHFWPDGSCLDLHANLQDSIDAVGRFSSAAEARRFTAFCLESQRLYHFMEKAYIRSERPSLRTMTQDLGPQGLMMLGGLGPFASLWKSLGRHFTDPRLRQLFARYATYCGGSPWHAPATLMLIAYVEQRGVWAADGGMQALGKGVAQAAEQLGVAIRVNTPVNEIQTQHGAVCGVRLRSGEEIRADAVIFNGEAAALHAGLLGKAAVPAVPSKDALYPRSLSALTFAIAGQAEGLDLSFHNLFFQDEYEAEFRDIFNRLSLPRRPTLYVCAQDRYAGDIPTSPKPGGRNRNGDARDMGAERLFCLINAPACGDGPLFTEEEIAACQNNAFGLMARAGLRLQFQPHQIHTTTPHQFEAMFPASGGALYGMAPHGWMSSFRRPAAQTPVRGLFLAGGSAHPGAGVPMAALSGRLAAATLMAHLDSTRRSRRVVISGGMSMA